LNCSLAWVKEGMGTGGRLRHQTKHCLLAALGKPVFLHGGYLLARRALGPVSAMGDRANLLLYYACLH
jgi:hypothetical protein